MARLLRAQTPTVGASAAVMEAAAAIAPAEVTRHLGVLAADSLRHRDTPSRGLETTARYIAAELQRLGLQPGVQNDGPLAWLQRYPVPGQQRVDYAQSTLFLFARPAFRGKNLVSENGNSVLKTVALSFATAAYFVADVGPQAIAMKSFDMDLVTGGYITPGHSMAVVAGRQSVASIRQAAGAIHEKIVVYVPLANVDSAVRRQIMAELYVASQGVLVASGEDSASFAAALAERQQPVAVVDEYIRTARSATGQRWWPWAAAVWAGSLRDLLGAAGEDLTQLRADTTPVVRVLPPWATTALVARQAVATAALITAPNVVGVLKGGDTILQHEYIVISTHMDDRGGRPSAADSFSTSVLKDNAPGIAGLLAIAEAFSQPGARPRRSLIFLATSGRAQDFWGAHYFAGDPPIPGKVIANFTLDLTGRFAAHSIVVDGLRDVELPVSPEWIAAIHPEIGLLVADGGTVARPRSDHFAFVRRMFPSMYVHADEFDGSASPTAVDAEQVARISRLIYYVGEAVGNADQRPRWTAEGRQQFGPLLEP